MKCVHKKLLYVGVDKNISSSIQAHIMFILSYRPLFQNCVYATDSKNKWYNNLIKYLYMIKHNKYYII